jgi:hypothetical protein
MHFASQLCLKLLPRARVVSGLPRVFTKMRKPWLTRHKKKVNGVVDGGDAATHNSKPLTCESHAGSPGFAVVKWFHDFPG